MPSSFDRQAGRIPARRRAPVLALSLLGLGLMAPDRAGAILNGSENSGPLARGSLMVLSAKGGVCSGVVVAPDIVLTAGHCAAGSLEHRVHYRGDDGSPVLLVPAATAVHPGYDSGAVAGRRRSVDLALIRLAEPLPARFAAAALSGSEVARGATLALGGYGVLREGDARSTGTFRIAHLAVIEPYGRSRILVWAADPARKPGIPASGACQGDSGGPIALAEDGPVFAISTWASGPKGRGCGDISQGVLLGPQRAWIDRTLAQWGRTATWRD